MAGETENCPICVSGDAKVIQTGPAAEGDWQINCQVCGDFALEHLAKIRVTNEIASRGDRKSAVLSYYIRRMQKEANQPQVTLQLIDDFLNRNLPSASEQSENFILWLGDRTEPGGTVKVTPSVDYAHIGANFKRGLAWIMREMMGNLLETRQPGDYACLSLAGWDKYSERERERRSWLCPLAIPDWIKFTRYFMRHVSRRVFH